MNLMNQVRAFLARAIDLPAGLNIFTGWPVQRRAFSPTVSYHVIPGAGPQWLRMRNARFGPNEILSHLGILEPPVDVHDVAARLEIRVMRVHQPGWDGALDSAQDSATIWLDAGVARVRERFTLAHEMGHLMSDPLGRQFRDQSISYPGAGPSETRANAFAAKLLVPSWMLDVYYSRLGGNLSRLAAKFEVSTRTMEICLSTAGIRSRA